MTQTFATAIVGAGGFGREILEYAQDAGQAGWPFEVVGFFDDRVGAREGWEGAPRLGAIADIASSTVSHLIIAVGDPGARRQLRRVTDEAGKQLATLVHPSAYVSRSAVLGLGTVVCPFGMVGANSHVGGNVSINVYGSIGHDAAVGDDCVISPYAAVTGSVRLGKGVFLGTHSTIAPGVRIGEWSQVVAGAFVKREAPDGSLLAGSPAKGRVMFKVPAEGEEPSS